MGVTRPKLLKHVCLEDEEISSADVGQEKKAWPWQHRSSRGSRAGSVPILPQDKWEELVSQDSHLEIFGHVSSMTLDTIMKYAFSHQGSVQTDRSVTALQGRGPVFMNGKDLPEGSKGSVSYQHKK